MATYEIGERIKKARADCGMTQEELAYGICSAGTLSKIENGVQVPNKKTFESLMQRLGEPEYLYSIHLSRNEVREMKLYRQIERCLQKEDMIRAEQLLKQYQDSFAGTKKLERQSYQAIVALWHAKQGAAPTQVIEELEAALRLTIKEYRREKPKSSKRLTFEEVSILNNIAVQYYQMGDRERAFSYLEWLKEYFERNELDEEEQAEVYPLILCNYADMLHMQGSLQEAKKAARRGIWLCKEYAQTASLPYLLGSMARILLSMGKRGEAEEYFKQAECLMCIMGSYGALKHLRENNRESLSLLL